MPRWRTLEAVLFDLDDTLIDEHDAANAALEEAVRQSVPDHAIQAADVHAALRSIFTTADQQSFPNWVWYSARPEHWNAALASLGVLEFERGNQIVECFREEFLGRIRLMPGAEETLRRTGSRYALALMTNGPARLRRAEMERLGIDDYFETIVISSEVRFTKPDPQFFMQALVDIGCRAGDAAMVGDDPFEDVLGAKATGLRSVWFNRRCERLPPDTPPPDIELRALTDLPEQLGM
jgi:putative hydrolase of the HAD superfamily